jgi:hypothetical protein
MICAGNATKQSNYHLVTIYVTTPQNAMNKPALLNLKALRRTCFALPAAPRYQGNNNSNVNQRVPIRWTEAFGTQTW